MPYQIYNLQGFVPMKTSRPSCNSSLFIYTSAFACLINDSQISSISMLVSQLDQTSEGTTGVP